MGQMTQEERGALFEKLAKLNPRREAEVRIYVDTYADYCVAQANIEANGTIVFHPRTGAPIENPYLRIRDRAGKVITDSRLRTGDLWRREPTPSPKR